MIVIEGTVRIPPARLEDARPVMEQMIRASRAEAGCLDYAYSVDVLDPGLIRVSERWESRSLALPTGRCASMRQSPSQSERNPGPEANLSREPCLLAKALV